MIFFFFFFSGKPAAQFSQTLPCYARGERGCISRMTRQGRRSLGASHPLKIADKTLVIEAFSRLRFVTRVGPPKRLPLTRHPGNLSPFSRCYQIFTATGERSIPFDYHERGQGQPGRRVPTGCKSQPGFHCP